MNKERIPGECCPRALSSNRMSGSLPLIESVSESLLIICQSQELSSTCPVRDLGSLGTHWVDMVMVWMNHLHPNSPHPRLKDHRGRVGGKDARASRWRGVL